MRKKRFKLGVVLVAVLLLIAWFAAGQRGTFNLYRFASKKNQLQSEIKNLQEKKKELETLRDKIKNDPAYVEKIAREKYNMKKKGERVYQIVEE